MTLRESACNGLLAAGMLGIAAAGVASIFIVNPQKNSDMFVGSQIAHKEVIYPDCFLVEL